MLIWGAYEDVFGIDMEPSLTEIFNDSQVNLDVDHLANAQCNRASLQSLNNYGIIVFDTHGSGGNLLLTREEVEPWVCDAGRAASALMKELPLLKAERPNEQLTFDWT